MEEPHEAEEQQNAPSSTSASPGPKSVEEVPASIELPKSRRGRHGYPPLTLDQFRQLELVLLNNGYREIV